MPSEREGLALAVLEAMAHERPLVVSDGLGNPEAVGAAGAVVPVGDVPALADAMGRLAANPAERAVAARWGAGGWKPSSRALPRSDAAVFTELRRRVRAVGSKHHVERGAQGEPPGIATEPVSGGTSQRGSGVSHAQDRQGEIAGVGRCGHEAIAPIVHELDRRVVRPRDDHARSARRRASTTIRP